MTDPTDPTDPTPPTATPGVPAAPVPPGAGPDLPAAGSIEELQVLAEGGTAVGVLALGEVERRALPTVRGLAAWLAFTGVAVALDGWAGGAVGVVVAAVVLAGVRRRVLGALGVAALAAVPALVVADGIPAEAEVAPAFVSRSLWPHHLTFVGLALLGAWVVLDVVAHRRAAREDGRDPAEVVAEVEPPLASLGDRARVVVVAVVAAAALAASAAVLLQ